MLRLLDLRSRRDSACRSRLWPAGALGVLAMTTAVLWGAGCQPPPYVTLEIGVDRQSVAEEVTTIGIGLASEGEYRLSRQLTVADVNRLKGGELTVTVTSESGSAEDLIVEGLTQQSGGAFEIVGRAFVTVNFGDEVTKQVVLRQPCDGDDHPTRSSDVDERCGDNVAVCNGRTQVCQSQVCQCPESFCGDSFTDVALGEECDDGNLNPNDGCDRCAATEWQASVILGLGSGNGDPRQLPLDRPVDVAADANGAFLVADSNAGRVWRVQDGRVSLFAGSGRGVYSEADEGGPAALAAIERPTAIAVDGFQRVFIAEGFSGGFDPRIRVVDERGTISTFAQTDQGTLQCPNGLAADQDGTLYIADCADVVWVVPPGADQPERFAGTGEFFLTDEIGDGGLATLANLYGVSGVTTDGRGRVFITEEFGNRIRVVEDGRIATIAGDINGFGGFSGDGGPARDARLDGPTGILVDADGSIIFSDSYNARVRSISPDGTIRTIAGNGLPVGGLDDVLAIETSFSFPTGLARSTDGSLLIIDSPSRKVRAVAPGTPLVSTVLGLGQPEVGGDGGLATSATFRAPGGLAVTGDGLLIVDPDAHRVRAVSFDDQQVQAFAGNGELNGRGESGLSGDGEAAVDAQLNLPKAVAVGVGGKVLIADQGNRRIRRVDENGKIESIVGGGTLPLPNAPQNAKELLVEPAGIASAEDEKVYFSDVNSASIGVLNTDGTAQRLAGTPDGEAGEDDGSALITRLRVPAGLFVDEENARVVFADAASHLVRAVDLSTETVVTLAGGTPLLDGEHGDGYAPYLDFEGPATQAWLGSPDRVTTDEAGRIYISDPSDSRIREVSTDGTVRVVAGTGVNAFSGGATGFNGDGILATDALLDFPEGIAVNNGIVYVADRFNQRIRAITLSTGLIETIAGNPEFGTFFYIGGYSGDEGPAVDAELNEPSDVVYRRGSLLVADSANGRVRKIDLATGIIETFAGGGLIDPIAGPQAAEANFTCPTGLAVGPDDSVYIAEACTHRIWRVDSLSGAITHIAGTGAAGNAGDGGSARAARLSFPVDLDVTANGDILIADNGNHRVRLIGADGRIQSFTGAATWPAFAGDGADVALTRLGFPSDVHVAPDGSILIADSGNNRIRRVSPPLEGNPTTTTVVGSAAPGDGGDAQDAILSEPLAVISDEEGGFYVADTAHFVVRHVDDTGVIRTVAGTGAPPFDAQFNEGGLATETRLTGPTGLALRGNQLYIADAFSARVRVVNLDTGILRTFAGLVDPGSGRFENARLDLPNALAETEAGLFVAQGDGRVRLVDEIGQEVRTVIGTDGATERDPVVPTAQARLFRDAAGLAYDAVNRTLFVTERDGHSIRQVQVEDPADERTWTVSDFAGAAETADHLDGPLDRARFRRPSGLTFHAETETLFVADTGNHVVRAIDLPTGTVRTAVGVPEELGDAADSVRPNTANLNAPQGVAVASDGTLFVADTRNNVVRRVRNNLVTRVLGDGQSASSGEGRPARNFPVDAPQGLRLDAYGNLLVTSRTAVRVVVPGIDGVSGSSQVLSVYGNNASVRYPENITRCVSDVVMMSIAPVDDLTQATTDAELTALNSGEDRLLLIDACQGMLIEVQRFRPALDPTPSAGAEAESSETSSDE